MAIKMTERQQAALLKAIDTSGVFVTCGSKQNTNIMSTHWGSAGKFWNRQVFVLPVRQNKLSHRLLDETKCFAISVPVKDMRKEIIECDHLSGYDSNKFETLRLHPRRAKKIPTYTISECGLFIECRVIYAADMQREHLDERLFGEIYEGKAFHTMYFGEIVESYYAEE
jgi:flavin reductase (DIM6/NTAB) family NADH-FMN oxidoreductase RutF